MKKKWIVALSVCFVLVGCATIGTIMSDVEQPPYTVRAASGNIDVRQYAPLIVAEVEVSGARDEAISAGFRLLADYIFGNNTTQQAIPMTAPVQQEASQKIAMTAPVQQQASGDAWKVSFVMPSEYTLATLPKPNNAQVQLKAISEKTYVAIRFSGRSSEDNIAKHEALLQAYITENQLQTLGMPKYAFYNPPWTLPMFRRNEILVELNAEP